MKADRTFIPIPDVPRSTHYIGRSLLVGSHYRGIIDELQLWSTVRTKTEIRASLNGPAAPASTGLLMQYLFNEESGNNITDSSGNNLHAIEGLFCEGEACRVAVSNEKIQCGDGARGGAEVMHSFPFTLQWLDTALHSPLYLLPLLCPFLCRFSAASYQECDDGNLDSGDGCSSSCKVEAGYVCFGGEDRTSTDNCDQAQTVFYDGFESNSLASWNWKGGVYGSWAAGPE